MMTIKEKIINYFTNSPELKVLFVFDTFSLLQSDIEVDATEWGDEYVYHVFQGDWFATKIRLATEWADKRVILFFDSRYPEPARHDQTSCRNFPLLGILEANKVFRQEDEKAFMDQHNIPAEHYGFVRRHIHELNSEKYNRILSPYYGTSAFSSDLAHRAIISGYMDATQLLEWYQILARLIIQTVNAPQKAIAFFIKAYKQKDIVEAIDNRLMALCGQKLSIGIEDKMRPIAEALKYNAIVQKLAIEKADPYKELKIEGILAQQRINKLLGDIADNQRLYTQFTPAFEKLSENIREGVIVDVYGADADYGYWSEPLCAQIITHVVATSVQSNPEYAINRLTSLLRYLDTDSALMRKLKFAIAVARYYNERNAVGSLCFNTPDLYIQNYTSKFYLLDLHYRKVIAAYTALGIDEVSPRIDTMRSEINKNYAEFANELNLEWLNCLKDFGNGFSSISSITRQQDFYRNNVQNLANKVVVIVSDAFRYELAAELMEKLQAKKHIATLAPSLAMLPTETKYCKPSLLPHDALVFTGDNLEVDGKVLGSTPLRTAQLQKFNDKAICIDYKELQALTTKAERRDVFKSQVVYIFHNTIDEMGHSCSAKTFTSACKDAIEELAQLVSFLHDTVTVTNVFITADHGFLYNDQVFEDKDKQKVEEDALESKSRYYITNSADDKQGITKFKLSEVSGMQGDQYVAVPIGTNRLAAPAGGYEFAHGGASLQELIIPVVFSKYKRENEKEKVGVELLESTVHIVSSRMKVHLIQKEAVDMDRLERTVICAIYKDDVAISEERIVLLNFNDVDSTKRMVELDFNVPISGSRDILKFKVFDEKDKLNPLISQNVINNTLIEQDDF